MDFLRVSHSVGSSIIGSLTKIFLQFFESCLPFIDGVFDLAIELWLEHKIIGMMMSPLRSLLEHIHLVVRILTIPTNTEGVGGLILPVSNQLRETVWSPGAVRLLFAYLLPGGPGLPCPFPG